MISTGPKCAKARKFHRYDLSYAINVLKKNKMGYIKEPKGVNFIVEPHVVTEEDQKIMSKIIADYKATGKITRAPRSKKVRTARKNVKRK